MEKIVWKGTFAEAEEHDHSYWAMQTEQARLDAMLRIREVLYKGCNEPIVKVAIKRKLGEEEE
jgi:hypothetical protein